MEKDRNLKGNEQLEESIDQLKKSLTDENLTHTLSIFRKRMKEKGHLVVAVKMSQDGKMELRTVQTGDSKQWFAAFTSFAEQNMGGDNIKSALTGEIEKLFATCLQTKEVEGIMLNPWNRTLKMDKTLISVIMGN